jgi:DNA-binding XRE family transcriptional regulator
MGRAKVIRYQTPSGPLFATLPGGLKRRRPRDFVEWATLRGWKMLPAWELDPPGYLLRLAREKARLTQRKLAARMGVSQQAVASAERWDANPTVAFLRRWAEACGVDVRLDLG